MAYVMTRVGEKTWNSLQTTLRQAAREGLINPDVIENINLRPTHIIDIYKMRRGKYKNVRIWINLHLGTGYRKDLFITTADNRPITTTVDIYSSSLEVLIEDWTSKIG